jgi:hypothetical protein
MSLSSISMNLKKAILAVRLGVVKPCGGDDVDNPFPK